MPSILFGQLQDADIPIDENAVRSTATPVDPGRDAADIDNAPEFNELDTDPNDHVGMSTRGVSGDYTPIEKFSPSWSDDVDQAHNANDIIDRQVSSSGTAAAREKAGEYGHGTMAVTRSIEPVIRDGGAMGNDYFAAYDPDIQSSMTRETGIQADSQGYGPGRENVGNVAAYGKTASREASQSASYAAFFSAQTGK
jgi:hypothetical protein